MDMRFLHPFSVGYGAHTTPIMAAKSLPSINIYQDPMALARPGVAPLAFVCEFPLAYDGVVAWLRSSPKRYTVS
jgi:hypothetical protein